MASFDLPAQVVSELKRELTGASDSARVKILNQLGSAYLNINADSAIYYFNQAGKTSTSVQYQKGRLHALGGNGFAQYAKGNHDEAALLFRKVLRQADSLHIELKNKEYYRLGLAMAIFQDLPVEATKLAHDALQGHRGNNDEVGQIKALAGLGKIYAQRMNYPKAIDQYVEAIELARSQSEQELAGNNLIAAAALYNKQGNTPKALEYYFQAIDIGDHLGDKGMASAAKLQVAHIYYSQKKLQQALALYVDVLSHFEATGDTEGQMDLNYFIGMTHKSKADHQSALNYFFKAHQHARKLDNKSMMAKIHNERANSYLQSGKLSLATKNADWAFGLAKKEDNTEELMRAYLVYSDISARAKKFGQALRYYKRYVIYRDKLYEEQQKAELTTMEKEYKSREMEIEKLILEKDRASQIKVAETLKQGELAVEEKNNELFQLSAKNDKLKNNTLIGSMILLLLFSLGTIIAYKNKLDDNRVLINQKDEIVKQKENLLKKNKRLIELNEEKDNLVNMVAHDLRSPLDQIKGLVNVIKMNEDGKGKNQEYIDMISYAADRMRGLIRRTLNIRNIDKQEVDPSEEVFDVSKIVNEVLTNYVELANRKNLTIHSELQRNGCFVKADMNYMIQILENLMSNAIKFSPRGKAIRVKSGKYKNIVRIEIIDQGPGIRKEDMPRLFKKFQRLAARPTGNEDSTGLGLSIVKRFVDSMGGEVRCESTFGEGANFIVEFEAYQQPDGRKA